MRKLYIGFSKAKSKFAILSKLIMWFQATTFSHVYVRFNSDFLNRTFIYQASGSKVNFENIQTFSQHAEIVKEFELKVSNDKYKKVLQFAIDNVGKPYSFKGLVGMAVVCIQRKLGFKPNNPFKDRYDAYFCSELASTILEKIDSKFEYDSENLGPKEVFDILVELNKV